MRRNCPLSGWCIRVSVIWRFRHHHRRSCRSLARSESQL